MKHSTYTSYEELPLMLSVAEVAAVLGISRAGAYELVHGNEFKKRTAVTKEESPASQAKAKQPRQQSSLSFIAAMTNP